MSDHIINQRDGDVARITIDRPDEGGIISDEMAVELTAMISAAAADAKLVVLRSTGPDFCLGRDRGGRPFTPPSDALEYRGQSEVVFDYYNAFRGAQVPVITAVQGRALGFGCATAALCDITIAADTARFALPEMGHGIMPTMAMSSLVDRAARKGVVYLTYSHKEVDAQTALAYGLVSLVVPEAELDAALEDLVQRITQAKMAAVRAVKEFATSALTMDITAVNAFAKNLHATINTSNEMGRG
jgi:enoyl-CoA hydratase